MCGILGLYNPAEFQSDVAPFDAALDRLRRRGPDDFGLWKDAHVHLGHRRLAIVDLSAAGHQPMLSADGRYVIVFNGEIYNHRSIRSLLAPLGGWRSSSDTETLLEAYRTWGVECLARLNGMFAFAIWDRQERRLFVARDRLGVKPLYYSWHNNRFGFASRPGALNDLGATRDEIDIEALRMYLELGYIPAPLSFYRDIRKLPPAHYLLIDERGPRLNRYWDYQHIAPDPKLLLRPESALVDELDHLIRQAVEIRLMSDVPLGAFLSGGIDSALVVAAMKAAGVAHPKTFTIAFAEKRFDEGPAAARIAAHLGVDHSCETMGVDSLLQLLPFYVQQFDEPFADSSAFPTMAVSRLARCDVTVALSGDGGDEQFGGYHYYDLVARLAPIAAWPSGEKRLLGRALRCMPSHRAKLLAGALHPNGPAESFNYLRSFSKDFPTLLSSDASCAQDLSEGLFARAAKGFPDGLSGAEIGMRLDTRFTLPDDYLQKVDGASMAYSLEARCPLTDYRLVEWAMRLPLSFKIRGRQTKYLLKKVLCKYIPAEMVYRPKMGFAIPIGEWLRGPLRSWALDLINDDAVMSRLPLDRVRVRRLFDLQASGSREAHPLVWGVLMLLSFVAQHDRRIGIPEAPRQRVA